MTFAGCGDRGTAGTRSYGYNALGRLTGDTARAGCSHLLATSKGILKESLATRHAVTLRVRPRRNRSRVRLSALEAVKRTLGIPGALSRIKQTCRTAPMPSAVATGGDVLRYGCFGSCEGMVTQAATSLCTQDEFHRCSD